FDSLMELERNISARNAILALIREHLAASEPHNAIHAEASVPILTRTAKLVSSNYTPTSLVELFKQKLEAVGGHCLVAHDDSEVVAAFERIISDLRKTPLPARRLAVSDAPELERFLKQTDLDVDQISVGTSSSELFGYDMGLSTAQAAIAETGTLVLESHAERHRLVSLVPPVHIAIIAASCICLTLGEALEALRRNGSPAGS